MVWHDKPITEQMIDAALDHASTCELRLWEAIEQARETNSGVVPLQLVTDYLQADDEYHRLKIRQHQQEAKAA